MTGFTIGDVRIGRIEETLGLGFEPAALLPDFEPEAIERHAEWLVPNFYSPPDARFVASQHSWLVRTRDHTVLVDSCVGNHKERPALERFHRLQRPYLDRLHDAGVGPGDIDIVLCTHLHVDHVGWNTRLDNGRWVPTFSNARYIFSRREEAFWNPETGNADFALNAGVYEDSVTPVIEAGQAQMIDGVHAIDDALTIEPAPGHTPGHVVLKARSRDAEGVFSGDTVHNPIQVCYPQWNSAFCEDAAQAWATRRELLEYCAEHRALLLPAHFGIPHAGRVVHANGAFAMDFAAP